jgi:hypothetical protein
MNSQCRDESAWLVGTRNKTEGEPYVCRSVAVHVQGCACAAVWPMQKHLGTVVAMWPCGHVCWVMCMCTLPSGHVSGRCACACGHVAMRICFMWTCMLSDVHVVMCTTEQGVPPCVLGVHLARLRLHGTLEVHGGSFRATRQCHFIDSHLQSLCHVCHHPCTAVMGTFSVASQLATVQPLVKTWKGVLMQIAECVRCSEAAAVLCLFPPPPHTPHPLLTHHLPSGRA